MDCFYSHGVKAWGRGEFTCMRSAYISENQDERIQWNDSSRFSYFTHPTQSGESLHGNMFFR